MRPIKYLLSSLVDYDFELNLVLLIALCLTISSIVLGRFQRFLFNADSNPNSKFTLLDLSTDTILVDLFEGFLNIFHYTWTYIAFDWFHRLIMANGGHDWLAKNCDTHNNENKTALLNVGDILDRIYAKDRTVSLIFLKQRSIKSNSNKY